MKDAARLRALVFERTGVAIDEKDPIMGVLAACAEQTEEIGERLLRRTAPVRVVLASAVSALVFGSIAAMGAWYVARTQTAGERAEWVRVQTDPRMAELLTSAEGKAGLRLAQMGVARLLATCKGRPSWRIQEGYCIPRTADGQPDGFRIGPTK